MPELPEVETIRAQLQPLLQGSLIVSAWSFGTPKFEQAGHAAGYRVIDLRRRGKYLLVGLADATVSPSTVASTDEVTRDLDRELVIHLGMTGKLSIDSPPGGSSPSKISAAFASRTRPPHRRAEWLLDDGRVLEFTDIRRFGRIAIVEPGGYFELPTLHALGPEPFSDEFTPELLRNAIRRSNQGAKALLMSQRVVAGLGNIYVDEALWLAGVHPKATNITRQRAVELRDAIREVLESGIRNGGTTLRDYRDASGATGSNQHQLNCYGQAGLPCVRCGTQMKKSVIGGRSTTHCPLCQRRR